MKFFSREDPSTQVVETTS